MHYASFVAPIAPPAADAWTWEATATIIQAIATIVALIGVGVTFVFAARSERRERERAHQEAVSAAESARRSEATAERTEAAARLSIDTLSRIAEAIEAVAGKHFSPPTVVAPAPAERVRWSLDHFQGDTYILTNTGTAIAYDVSLSADPTLMTPDELPPAQDMRPDDNVTFMAAATMATRDKTITVEWSANQGDNASRETWRYPLPPRPPRR